MIELRNDRLRFSFPEVHADARFELEFQRTLRIPVDGNNHFLPPGLGAFPLRHVDDFSERLPATWQRRGGIMLPMYQSEALWISFHSITGYPFAVKVAAGKINAVTGESWSDALHQDPQDYMVIPGQPWLDGFCVGKDIIRQFVAMPLGSGYSAEEQITGEAEYGGLQVIVYPLKRQAWESRPHRQASIEGIDLNVPICCLASPAADMGLAPGGRMQQSIYDDTETFANWDQGHSSRCFVHIANSMVWQSVTASRPPTPPPTAADYTQAGLPWFAYYDGDREALESKEALVALKSIGEMGKERGDVPIPENAPVSDPIVKRIHPDGRGSNVVNEGEF